jgi:hypothetical protein
MSELRTKIAAGATILALGGLGGLALSHPQAPVKATQSQAAGEQPGKQAAIPATLDRGDHLEGEAADD